MRDQFDPYTQPDPTRRLCFSLLILHGDTKKGTVERIDDQPSVGLVMARPGQLGHTKLSCRRLFSGRGLICGRNAKAKKYCNQRTKENTRDLYGSTNLLHSRTTEEWKSNISLVRKCLQ